MRNSRNSYLIKNTIIFTLGNLGSKFISFFLIPLYTNALTTAEYGVVDLVATVGTVAVPLLTLNICESVMRFALDKDANTRKITQIGTRILLIGMMVGLLIFPICRSFDKISEYAVFCLFLCRFFGSKSALFVRFARERTVDLLLDRKCSTYFFYCGVKYSVPLGL